MIKRNQGSTAVALVLLTLVFCSFRAGAQNPPSAESPTVEQLLERISNLEDRLDALETKMDRQPVLHYTAPQVIPHATEDLLRRYRRGEINGIPYHVIPVEGQSESGDGKTLQLPQSVEGGEPHRVEGGQ